MSFKHLGGTEFQLDMLGFLEELQALARTGLNYTKDPFERERCERLLALASQQYGEALDVPPAEVRGRLVGELGTITPKVGAHAAVFDAAGRILLVQRADDRRWCLPCGWVEPNESPEEAAVRETREETGLSVRVRTLTGVFTRRANAGYGPHSAIAIGYLCEQVGGAVRACHEVLDVQFRCISDVTDWHEKHHEYAQAAAAVHTARCSGTEHTS